jgi:hypothetical protein
MGMGRWNPGCNCCDDVSCVDWDGTPPATIQLTLPATCERAGTHVLSGTIQAYSSDCPASTSTTSVATLCESWDLNIGVGAAEDTVALSVFVGTNGITYIAACVGNEAGASGAVDAGNVWAMSAGGITSWDELDGLSLPWTNSREDLEGMADCTGSPPDEAVISFVP